MKVWTSSPNLKVREKLSSLSASGFDLIRTLGQVAAWNYSSDRD
jgi:hypothetical protein